MSCEFWWYYVYVYSDTLRMSIYMYSDTISGYYTYIYIYIYTYILTLYVCQIYSVYISSAILRMSIYMYSAFIRISQFIHSDILRLHIQPIFCHPAYVYMHTFWHPTYDLLCSASPVKTASKVTIAQNSDHSEIYFSSQKTDQHEMYCFSVILSSILRMRM